MFIIEWLSNQKLSDWLQGAGARGAASAAVWIALRNERLEREREAAAAHLRAQVLAAAIGPILRDITMAVQIRNGLLQTTRGVAPGQVPRLEELSIPLPAIFMNTIDRIDVFGVQIAARMYTLIHRINDYNRHVDACREFDVPYRSWDAALRPKLALVRETADVLTPALAVFSHELAPDEPETERTAGRISFRNRFVLKR